MLKDNEFYFDNEEIGLDPSTSHPNFRAHFTEEFYYDCVDEEAPFGSDEGSDTLGELQEYVKENREIDMDKFPKRIMEIWDMPYLPPDTLDIDKIKAIIAGPDDVIPMSQHLLINDQVIVASALGQIKVMGKVNLRLRDLALRSMRRILIVAELEAYGFSKITQKMIEDLERFQNPPQPEPSEIAKQLIDYLDCPCQIFCGLLDDDDMIYSYEQALEDGKTKGYTPLLITADDILLESLELTMEDNDFAFNAEGAKAYREKMLQESQKLNPEQVTKGLIAQLEEELEEDGIPEAGPVEDGDMRNRFSSFWDYDTSLTKEVILAKIPTANSWELPLYVPMGGFNECPSPEHQAAIMRYWHEKHGAIPGAVTYDEWEFILPEPVADKDTALELAYEQYGFCYDRVEQYAEDYSIGKLADCLMKSTVWYFWWD